ncbi:MAG: T9SS type A sorting domain-containing protein [Saprospiraceae bacterium]|nr:T9SS type A sorting domain-containing protein [Saprospiraceae bacterium]
MYPNPVCNGKCTIALTEDQTINARYIIRDITGKVVFEELKPSLINEISLNRAGWYSIELIQSGQPVSYGKLIIQ